MEPKDLPCFLNGRYTTLSQATLHPTDLGFVRGYAIFDVMPLVQGKPFLWERHFERLEKSAEALNLVLPVDQDAFQEILRTLIEKSEDANLSFRTIVSGGPSADGFVPEAGNETFLVIAEHAHEYPEEIFTKGIKVLTLEFERSVPQVKLANHAIAIRELPKRKAEGAFETLYVKDGMISECSQSNIFIVKDGVLATTWDNVLWGVTQGLVIELAEQAGIVVEKRGISLDEVLSADEVFITGSSKKIVPVVNIDGKTIGTGVLGDVTSKLQNLFEEYCEKY